MIYCINFILEFIINIAILLGLGLLAYLFFRLRSIDSDIENKYKLFEKDRKEKIDTGKREGVVEDVVNGQIEKLQKDLDISIAPLKRERERIISKIPFLK
jgi:hypothetical protein